MSEVNIQEIVIDVSIDMMFAVKFNQYSNNSQQLIIVVTDSGRVVRLAETDVCYFKMITPDGRAIFNDTTFDEYGRVVVNITESCCSHAGRGYAEIWIVNSESEFVLPTRRIPVIIKESVYDNSKVIASDEFDALSNLLIEVNSLINQGVDGSYAFATAYDNSLSKPVGIIPLAPYIVGKYNITCTSITVAGSPAITTGISVTKGTGYIVVSSTDWTESTVGSFATCELSFTKI